MRNVFTAWSALGLFACLIAARQSSALEVRHNVAFTKVNQSPWQPGPGFHEEFHFDDLQTSFNVNLPRLNGSPIATIADFLGIDLPLDANVGVRGKASGRAGLDFGYYVSGGRFNLKYPARSSLDIGTFPGSNVVLHGAPFSIQSEFLPGVSGRSYPRSLLVANAGAGYGQASVPGFGFESYSEPTFGTTFPYASAWATLGYDVRAEASVEARACFIACGTWTKTAKFGDARDVTLVEIDPSGVSIAGAERVQLFDQDIPVAGFGNVRVSYPDVRVGATGVDANHRLHGFDSKPIVSLQGQAEKLVPFIGPFLSNSVGPIGYDLLTTLGGPQLSLYQDFTFTPTPRVRLEFSTPVLARGTDGRFRPTNSVDFALGDDIELKTIVASPELVVRPTYFLRNTLRNETGLSLGVSFDVDVLTLNTPFGDVGPAFHGDLDFSDLFRVPVYTHSFEIPMGAVTGDNIALENVFLVGATVLNANVLAAALESRDGETGLATYDVTMLVHEVPYTGSAGPFPFNISLTGEEVFLLLGDSVDVPVQTVLMLENDLILGEGENAVNVGNAFCISCVDASAYFEDVNPSLLDAEGAPLYLAELFEFDDGLVDVGSDPILSLNNFVNNHTEIPTEVLPTEFVPEPTTFALVAAGLVGLISSGRRRKWHRRGPISTDAINPGEPS